MKVVRPENEEQIIEVIHYALSNKLQVKARGSGGSKNLCNHSSDICIDMRDYARLISIRGNQVTVQAGMKFHELNQFLWQRGLCLPTICEWDQATVGGAISTGSHGGSLYHGSVSNSVSGIRFIDGRGEIHEIFHEVSGLNELVISFGRVGVFLEITFDCEGSFFLDMEEYISTFDEFIDLYDRKCRLNEFYSTVWLPSTNQVLHFAGNRVALPKTGSAKRSVRFSPSIMVREALSSVMGKKSWLQFKGVVNAYNRSYEILAPLKTSPRMVQLIRTLLMHPIEMEFAIPYQATSDVLKELKLLFNCRRNYFPVGIRPGASEPLLLSPSHERNVTWISLFFMSGFQHRSCFYSCIDLLCTFSGRPHWGKYCKLPNNYLEEQYPGWSSFGDLISKYDPDNTFRNNFSKYLNL